MRASPAVVIARRRLLRSRSTARGDALQGALLRDAVLKWGYFFVNRCAELAVVGRRRERLFPLTFVAVERDRPALIERVERCVCASTVGARWPGWVVHGSSLAIEVPVLVVPRLWVGVGQVSGIPR